MGINGAKLEGPELNRTGYNPIQDENQKMVGDYWGWRGFHICLSKASDFEICGFTIRKTRSWAISMDKCHNYKVHDLDIVSDVKNGDGVNNRAGCHDFEVYNITGSTSDDTVAMTASGYTAAALSYPRGTYIYPLEPSKFENLEMTVEELSIRNGKVYNINTTGKHHGVICLAADGLQVRDIFINNVREPSASTRESVVKIYSGYGTSYSAGDLNRIRVNDILSKGAKYAVQVTHTVEDVWFNKIVQENSNGHLSGISDAEGVEITNS
jgi:polygalacturonase